VTFVAGNYTFQGPVTVSGSGSTVNFDSGEYTFVGGLSINPSATDATLNSPNGALFYFPSTSSLSVNASGASVQLAAPTTGPYAGIAIYQPGTATMTLAGGGADTVTGLIDVPLTSVMLGSNGDTFTLGGLVAGRVTLGSSVTMTVGG
jgi:hypothetical protein